MSHSEHVVRMLLMLFVPDRCHQSAFFHTQQMLNKSLLREQMHQQRPAQTCFRRAEVSVFGPGSTWEQLRILHSGMDGASWVCSYVRSSSAARYKGGAGSFCKTRLNRVQAYATERWRSDLSISTVSCSHFRFLPLHGNSFLDVEKQYI